MLRVDTYRRFARVESFSGQYTMIARAYIIQPGKSGALQTIGKVYNPESVFNHR